MAERMQTLSDGFGRDGLGIERGRAGVLVGWADLSRNPGRLSLVLGYDERCLGLIHPWAQAAALRGRGSGTLPGISTHSMHSY